MTCLHPHCSLCAPMSKCVVSKYLQIKQYCGRLGGGTQLAVHICQHLVVGLLQGNVFMLGWVITGCGQPSNYCIYRKKYS